MPTYRVTIVNRDFTSSEEIEANSADSARTGALRGALTIGADEICEGKMFFGAVITVQGDGGDAERMMVAIGISPLDSTQVNRPVLVQ